MTFCFRAPLHLFPAAFAPLSPTIILTIRYATPLFLKRHTLLKTPLSTTSTLMPLFRIPLHYFLHIHRTVLVSFTMYLISHFLVPFYSHHCSTIITSIHLSIGHSIYTSSSDILHPSPISALLPSIMFSHRGAYCPLLHQHFALPFLVSI